MITLRMLAINLVNTLSSCSLHLTISRLSPPDGEAVVVATALLDLTMQAWAVRTDQGSIVHVAAPSRMSIPLNVRPL